MATSNFLIFDESMNAIDTDQEYLAEGQRMSGVTPGLATPKMHNKLYRQCSVMAYAIASVLVARGYNADDSDPASLIDAIQRSFCHTVNGNTPNGVGAVTAVRPIDAWPVGSLFMTFQNVNPATLLGGGTWVRIKGRYLLAADDGDVVDGATTYGAMTKNVPLVSHNHSISISSSGKHAHSASGNTGYAGSHTHTTGSAGSHTHTVTGGNDDDHSGHFTIGYSTNMTATTNAAGAHTHGVSTVSDHRHSWSVSISDSGAHTHSGTTSTVGTGASFDVRPASIAVYVWRRTA